MGIRDAIARVKASFPPVITTNWPNLPVVGYGGSWDGQLEDVRSIMEMSPSQLWRSQPHLRTVVDFLARNIAQLGVHTYIRQADGDRVRTTTAVADRTFRRPNDYMTRYELVYALVGDLALYQCAYWMVTKARGRDYRVTPIPAAWVMGTKGDVLDPSAYIVQPPNGKQVEVPGKLIERFHGWDPLNQHTGTSPVNTLKMTLLEQMHSQRYREQQWRRGGRVGAVISRPPGHRWTPEQEHKFMLAFRDAYSGDDAPEAGGIPILQDGMTMTRLGFSAKEDEYIEGTKLALSTVAGVYHINPTMLGQLDNANYSNVREFRRMLYGDTLGPWLAQLEDRFNTFLLPRLGSPESHFVEFNIAEKLKGSFEEQAGVMSTSVGAPWMTRNEGRALQNLPALEGGDELITPLNVLVGGQASPQDGGTGEADVVELVAARVAQLLKEPSKGLLQVVPPSYRAIAAPSGPVAAPKALTGATGPASFKAVARAEHAASLQAVLAGHYARQRDALAGKAADDPRWNAELAADLYEQAMAITGEIGPTAALALGFDPESYDPAQTERFLLAVAESRASMINAKTGELLAAAAADDDEEHTAAKVFALAIAVRAVQEATTLSTTFTAFAATEAGKQVPAATTKTWIVNAANSRHKNVGGETVGINEKFSNGAEWPGDPSLGADGVAGCQCSVSVQTQEDQ